MTTELILRAQAGDDEAGLRLYRHLESRLRAMARQQLWGVGSELVRESSVVNLALARALGQDRAECRDTHHFLAIVRRMMREAICNAIRARRRHAHAELESSRASQENRLRLLEVYLDLEGHLDELQHLNPVWYEIFVASSHFGQSDSEIAQQMGTSRSYVQLHRSSAIEWLRARMKAYGE